MPVVIPDTYMYVTTITFVWLSRKKGLYTCKCTVYGLHQTTHAYLSEIVILENGEQCNRVNVGTLYTNYIQTTMASGFACVAGHHLNMRKVQMLTLKDYYVF